MALALSPTDLDAYLTRIGYGGSLQPTASTLGALHLAHVTCIPFENIDVLLGRPVRLDQASLHAKLVVGGRGGYCFEQNLLFAAVLGELGFKLTPLAARVRYRVSVVPPRTHMLLLVEADGERWIADVGFGGECLLLPVALIAGRTSPQFGWAYRVVPEDCGWLLQSLRGGQWLDLYAFSLEPQELADYEMANHYTSTYPSSRFLHSLTVQLPRPQVRHVLRNRELVADTGHGCTGQMLPDAAKLMQVLTEIFGLRLPDAAQVGAQLWACLG